MRYHYLFETDRQNGALENTEDGYTTECAERYPVVERQVVKLKATHWVVYAKISACLIGEPVRRGRIYSSGGNRKTVVWVGVPFQNVQSDFEATFSRSLEVNGSVYMVADRDSVVAFIGKLAAVRKRKLPPTFNIDNPMTYLNVVQPPGGMQRHGEYLQRFDAHTKTHGQATFYGADLDHHPGTCSTDGLLFPTALTHNSMYDFSWGGNGGRLVTTNEIWRSQGLDSLPEFVSNRDVSPLMEILEGVGVKENNELIGNTMHISVVTLWNMYVWGNTMRVEEFYKVCPAIGVPDEDGDEVSVG